MPSGNKRGRKSPIRGAWRKRRELVTRDGVGPVGIMTVRLDPRLRYLTEIAARQQRRTLPATLSGPSRKVSTTSNWATRRTPRWQWKAADYGTSAKLSGLLDLRRAIPLCLRTMSRAFGGTDP